MSDDTSTSHEKLVSFIVAMIASTANGFFYGYSIFSSRMALSVGLSRADVVLLGVLSQAGLGVLQYPTTLLLNYAQKKGISVDRLDKWMSIWCGILFVTATVGIGSIMYLCETGQCVSTGTSMGVMGLCFLMWGQGAGASFNSCSTVINFNNSANNALRRKQLVALSCSVGAGGVVIVIIYQFMLKDTVSLHAFMFGMAFCYICLTLARLRWMKRVKQKVVTQAASVSSSQDGVAAAESTELDEESGPRPSAVVIAQPVAASITPQPLSALLKSDVVWLTCLGTFIGIGTSGTCMSSLGNLGPQLEIGKDFTFTLTITFLAMQTFGRLVNAVVYGYGDWPFVFAFWQLFCVMGVSVFLMSPNPTGAFLSSAFVGMSFGGFHSSFPILAATSFPGNPTVDYSQSVGVAYAVASLGCIVVGQLTTVIYKAASLQDLRMTGFVGTFYFFVAVLLVSFLSSVLLGSRIVRNRKRQKASAVAAAAAVVRRAASPTSDVASGQTPADAVVILPSPNRAATVAAVLSEDQFMLPDLQPGDTADVAPAYAEVVARV